MTLAQRIIDEVCRYHGITIQQLVSDHRRKYPPKTLSAALMRLGNVDYITMKETMGLVWLNSVTRLLLTHRIMMKEDWKYKFVFEELINTIYPADSIKDTSTFDKPIIKSLNPASNGKLSGLNSRR